MFVHEFFENNPNIICIVMILVAMRICCQAITTQVLLSSESGSKTMLIPLWRQSWQEKNRFILSAKAEVFSGLKETQHNNYGNPFYSSRTVKTLRGISIPSQRWKSLLCGYERPHPEEETTLDTSPFITTHPEAQEAQTSLSGVTVMCGRLHIVISQTKLDFFFFFSGAMVLYRN